MRLVLILLALSGWSLFGWQWWVHQRPLVAVWSHTDDDVLWVEVPSENERGLEQMIQEAAAHHWLDVGDRDDANQRAEVWQAEAECWFRAVYSREWSSALDHAQPLPSTSTDGPVYVSCRPLRREP